MNAQDNPFGALDKLLLSSAQAKPKDEQHEKARVEDTGGRASSLPPSRKTSKSTPTSQSGTSAAELQTRKAVTLQNRAPAKSQSHQTANLQDRELAPPPSRKVAKLQDREPPESQSRKAALSRNRGTAALQRGTRKTINHGLTIFEDQLLSLKEIQLEREKVWGRKCRKEWFVSQRRA